MSKILFCDWDSETGSHDSTSLLDATNLSKYDILFFDPREFTTHNGFRDNRSDLRLAEYKSYSEWEFLAYLGKIKSITDQLHEFLDNGGIWVIRAEFPNSSIKVRKHSSTGQGRYTESVISLFFWLEEFIGDHSFQYILGNAIKFKNTRSPLYRHFRDCRVEYVQTQEKITKGTIETIAGSPGIISLPVLTRISFGHHHGQIFFIPRFTVKNEYVRLVKAFDKISWEEKYGPYKPKWVHEHDENLAKVNPYLQKISKLNREILKLENKRSEIEERSEKVQALSHILYSSGESLIESSRNALELVGFTFPKPPVAVTRAGFDFYGRDNQSHQLVGLAKATKSGPIHIDEFDRLGEKIYGCKLVNRSKALIIANADHHQPLEERGQWFDPEMIKQADSLECCLLSTAELFKIVRYILKKSKSSQIENIKRSLQRDIFECVGVFELNRKKYVLPVV